MKSCSPKTTVEGARSVEGRNVDLDDTAQVQEKLSQYEQRNQPRVDGVRKIQGEEDSSTNEARNTPYFTGDVQEFASRHVSAGMMDRTVEDDEPYYPEGGRGWLVLAATFIAAFW